MIKYYRDIFLSNDRMYFAITSWWKSKKRMG